MIPVTLDPDAEKEFYDAVMWYEDQQAGLGDAFHDAVVAGFRRIAAAPTTGSIMEGYDAKSGLRRIIVEKFPYAIIYAEAASSGNPYVLAVAHHSRRPNYWSRRRRRLAGD
jgi:plasmid stabilization system protein ParE